MKQAFTFLGIIFFMVGATYLLLSENKLLSKSHHKTAKKMGRSSPSKLIGEKPTRDFTPFELQRQRISEVATFTFQNTTTNESYELSEDELGEFSASLDALKSGMKVEVGPGQDTIPVYDENAIRDYIPADN